MADGVPKEKTYKVLATDEGVDRAFRKIAEIKPHVVKWWTAGAEPIQLLADGEVVMSQAWSGRSFSALQDKACRSGVEVQESLMSHCCALQKAISSQRKPCSTSVLGLIPNGLPNG